MNNNSSTNESAVAEKAPIAAYQAPAIESVVTFENLQREVLYAGAPTSANPPVPGT